MFEVQKQITSLGIIPQLIILIILFLLALFIVWYLLPFFRVRSQLNGATKRIRALRESKQLQLGELITKQELSELFSNKYFQPVWHAYSDSLHEQVTYQNGISTVTAIRTTVPAEGIFSAQSLVDAHLNVEFFKHLPGILTGVGIIGTFSGLINGVQKFTPALKSIQAGATESGSTQSSLFTGLEGLFGEVEGAFYASVAAIIAAMLITFLEKLLLAVCYRRLEDLCNELNTLFAAGVGEEYLSQLVKHAEETSTQTRLLKQELVNELSVILQTLTEQQVKQWEVLGQKLTERLDARFDAAEKQNLRIAELLGKLESVLLDERNEHDRRSNTFVGVLGTGLEKIGERVAGITENQGERVTEQLEKIVNNFLGAMQTTFGAKMEALARAVGDSVDSMGKMQSGFSILIEELRAGGQEERKAIAEAMAALLNNIKTNQQKSSDELDAALKNIGQGITDLLIKFDIDRQKTREEEFEGRKITQGIAIENSNRMTEQVTILVEQLGKTLVAIESNTSQLRQTSLDVIDKFRLAVKELNDGASLMSMAAEDFTTAGQQVAESVNATTALQSQMADSSEHLRDSMHVIQDVIAQYQGSQVQVATMVGEFRKLLEQAQLEASLNKKVVEDMQRMVSSFGILKDDMDDFVEGITQLLSDEYSKFVGSVNNANQTFHQQFGTAVQQLGDAIHTQSTTTQQLMDMVSKIKSGK